jgi:hypothetical protein
MKNKIKKVKPKRNENKIAKKKKSPKKKKEG